MESRTPFLSLQNFSIVRESRVILHPLDLNFYSGESVCVVGPNGSGKSTLLEALALGTRGATGSNALLGEREWTPERRAQQLAYLPQQVDIPLDFSVEDVVRFGRTPYPRSAEEEGIVEQALARWGLAEMRARKMQNLSGGERQRVHLARIDTQQTPTIILDEPSASLDLRTSQELYARLTATPERLFLYATHDLVFGPRHATRIVLMHEGRVLADGTWDALTEQFEKAFGVRVESIRN